MPRGLDRLRTFAPVPLSKIGEGLPPRRLDDEEIERWALRIASAVRGKKTARAIANAMGTVAEAFVASQTGGLGG